MIDKQQINEILIHHFSNLWVNENDRNFDYILNALPNDLHSLTSAQGEFLTSSISKEEIFSTLFSLSEEKSPSPYGLNVEFFKFF